MINTKALYNTLLSDSRITALVTEDNILNSYPDEFENFPCIVFVDENQSDTEYYENKPGASSCTVMIHIFTKKLADYVTSTQIAFAVADVMHDDLWNCSQNRELSDPDPDCEHRVLTFNKSIFG